MTRVKYGHFVPQLHLRYFSISDREQLYCFDKRTEQEYVMPVRRAAASRNFYDLEGQDNQFAEAAFNQIEGASGQHYRRLAELPIEDVTEGALKSLAALIAVQMLRTKAIRDSITRIHQEIDSGLATGPLLNGISGRFNFHLKHSLSKLRVRALEAIPNLPKEDQARAREMVDQQIAQAIVQAEAGEYPEILQRRPQAAVDELDRAKRSHLESIASSVKLHAHLLAACPWALIQPPPDATFWTTDNPVIKVHGSAESKDLSFSYFMPLTPTRGIAILPLGRKPCAPLRQLTGEEDQQIKYVQLLQASRHIFSNQSDFSVARALVSAHPQIREPFDNLVGSIRQP